MKNRKLTPKQNKNGIFIKSNGISQKVCNFNAEISKEIVVKRIDGTVERYFEMKASLKGDEQIFIISHAQFVDQSWVGIHLGVDAVVDSKVANRNEFCSIINKLSTDKIKTTSVQRLGFYEHDGVPYFLHTGGAISADGFNNVLLKACVEGPLRHCEIPQLSVDDNAQSLVENFLALSDIAINNKHIGTTLLAAVTRAPLTNLKLHKVTPVYVGDTGTGKTAVALIGQSCYGAKFENPPGSFTSSAKSMELLAQEGANIFVVIDDYTKAMKDPGTEKLVELIVGGVSNSTVRNIAVSATKNADCPLIAAVPLLTVECIPEMTKSRMERCMFIAFLNGDVDFKDLGSYQKSAAAGDYAKVLGLLIAFILKNHDRIKGSIDSIFERYRAGATTELEGKVHFRAPSNVADLMLGLHFFLEFCFKEGYISKEQAQRRRDEYFSDLIELVKQQSLLHENNDITSLVKYKLSCFFRRNEFIIHEIKGMKKAPVVKTYSENFLGWSNYDDNYFYILASQSKHILSKIPDDLKNLMGTGEKSFWSSMKRYGLLAETDVVAKKNVVRKTINNESVRVYSLDYSLLYSLPIPNSK
jgi:hypothetical protein